MKDSNRERAVVTAGGVVQGVGFRPFVYRLASELGLAGGVANSGDGVEIELEGPGRAVEEFLERLKSELPPLARLDRVSVERCLPLTGREWFAIGESLSGTCPRASIPPDTAVCPDCLREMIDPKDRRYRYPFINCTNCGPRYTISLGHPYDRPLTTMKDFTMCPRCRAEYDDPSDRRFHAQPIACPECGPHLELVDGGGALVQGDPVETARAALLEGSIVAVKGLGGFHLAVNAIDHRAVQRLRERKRREEKPLAMMAPDASAVRRFARLTPAEANVLASPIASIVLLRKRAAAGLSPSVAPGVPTYGFMLPYTPLHHLLIRDLTPALVMTSGNFSEEPMATGNEEALARLAGIADLFLLHDRTIATACDDSVVRVVAGKLRVFRRARGFVPQALALPKTGAGTKAVLALGSEMKNAFAIAADGAVYPGPHVGDLVNASSYRHFLKSIESYKQFLRIEPELLAVDLHPDYTNREYVRSHPDLPAVEVRHHHAHLASVLAETGDEALGGSR